MKFGLLIGLMLFSGVGTVQINKAAHPETVVAAAVAEPVQTGSIVFASNRTGSWNIFQMNLATRIVRNLTNSPADNYNPQLSPDGQSLVFYSNRDGNNQIYRLELGTGAVARLTNNAANEYDPTFSPNGKLIAFKSNKDDGHGDIWIMNVDGTRRRNLTPGLKSTEEWDPEFSPDGTRLYFTSGLQQFSEILMIYTGQGDRGGVYGVTKNDVPDWYPSVNPVTGEILVISRVPGNTNDALFVVSPDGRSRRQVLSLPSDSDDPAWSSDGKQIVFINRQSGEYNLYVVNADGSNPVLLEDSPSSELSPVFKKDTL